MDIRFFVDEKTIENWWRFINVQQRIWLIIPLPSFCKDEDIKTWNLILKIELGEHKCVQ